MSLKILIVDDDEIVIFLHKIVVVKSGLTSDPKSFLDGKAAFNYLNEKKEDDSILILLDINMPVMNGWEFLHSIQQLPLSNRISVIMVTSSINSTDREIARQYRQVIGFIEKPLDPEACKRIKDLIKEL